MVKTLHLVAEAPSPEPAGRAEGAQQGRRGGLSGGWRSPTSTQGAPHRGLAALRSVCTG